MLRFKTFLRSAQLVVSLLVMAFGVDLITKSNLGTSPISSVPYVLSLAFPFTFGEFTILINALIVLIQVLILRKAFPPQQILQLIVGTLFGFFVDFGMFIFSFVHPNYYGLRLMILLLGCILLAVGIYFEVNAKLVMNPGEGLVRALNLKTGRKFGSLKVAVDCTLVIIAVAISLLAFRSIRGIREGTIVSALLVGNIVRLTHFLVERIRYSRHTKRADVDRDTEELSA